MQFDELLETYVNGNRKDAAEAVLDLEPDERTTYLLELGAELGPADRHVFSVLYNEAENRRRRQTLGKEEVRRGRT